MMAYAAEYGESLAIARPIEMAPYEAGLDTVVITSGDFGLAYLNGRWAARSVSELFRNYVVLLTIVGSRSFSKTSGGKGFHNQGNHWCDLNFNKASS
jgi:hypothetical protein